ncbi:MAG: SURF1 family protein [Lacisediminihabitans sp.]
MWSIARRPRWIATLLLALAVAGGFAALGQWQLERGFATGTVLSRTTETAVPLSSMAQPQSPVTDAANGQTVTVRGSWVSGDYLVLSDRLNGAASGYWVVGHLAADAGTGRPVGLAVALGWVPTEADATSALTNLDSAPGRTVTVTGRYLPSEAPQDTNFEKSKVSTLAVSALINVWHTVDTGGVYGGYLVIHEPVGGLRLIDSPVPTTDVSPNALNLFYAAEWVVFAGFAIFLWYRLVKDAWEREQEEAGAGS